jgi:serine/threonine protein kinase
MAILTRYCVHAKQGLLRNGKVAVKELSQTNDIIEGRFKDELICLIKVKHKNVVRFLGYCSDTQEKAILYEGRYVLAEERRRFLCFEYVPNKSLHDYLKGTKFAPTLFVFLPPTKDDFSIFLSLVLPFS